jgi:hypothetical protein
MEAYVVGIVFLAAAFVGLYLVERKLR